MQAKKVEVPFGTGLKIGFATVLALLLALMAVGLYGIHQAERHLDSIVRHSLAKANQANIMQIALRERAVSMHSIAAMEDPFEKDAEFLAFQAIGLRFLEARQALEALPLGPEEKALLTQLENVTSMTRPLVTGVIEQAMRAESPEQRVEVFKVIKRDAIPNQKRITAELDRLMLMQEAAIQAASDRARQAHKDARHLIMGLGASAATLGLLIAYLAIRDATNQASRLQHQALFDDLSELPNRVLFQDRLQQAILVSKRENQPFALLALDLNRFKEVNDTLGHQYGDLLLQQVASRLRSVSRESDTIARMGGDEFSVLLPATGGAGSEVFAKKIMKALEAGFDLNGTPIEIGASIGVALFPDHGSDYEALMRRADAAMYVAKRARSGYEVYDSKKSPEGDLDLALRAELRHAIESEQLVLYYQPKISHQTSIVNGLEALVRWQHPTRGLIPPDRFIPIAEQTGLIRPLTAWVLEKAVAQCAKLQHLGMPLSMAVNHAYGASLGRP